VRPVGHAQAPDADDRLVGGRGEAHA
jgi:hypothetical protein